MARKSRRQRAARTVTAAATDPTLSNSDRAVAALMALLTEHSFEEVGMAQIATTTKLSLADLRAEFGSTLAILAAYVKEVDRQVLAGVDPDLAEESPRERLFDVLMRRLEILDPHKEAVRSLIRSSARNPGLALALNGIMVLSCQWMLTAAGISASGPKGMLRAQGLALLFGNVVRTWLNDSDSGHARTLAVLDRELERGQRFAGLLDGLCAIPKRLCALKRPGSSTRGRGARAAA
jgi:AcrR family transcriptional regulator